MKTIASILPIAAAVVSLAGCNEADTGRQTKTVGWLFDHRDELAVTLKACRDNPGELAKTPNYANEARNRSPSKR